MVKQPVKAERFKPQQTIGEQSGLEHFKLELQYIHMTGTSPWHLQA